MMNILEKIGISGSRFSTQKILVTALFVGIGFWLSSCYPGGPETANQLDVVTTDYDSTFNFSQQKTYFMPDTVRFLTNESNPNIDQGVAEQFTADLLTEVENNMASRGYVRVDTTSNNAPDLFVDVELLSIQNVGIVNMPGFGYWNGFYPDTWGWGGFGYNWYYPNYWGDYPVAYTYKTGTVIINISNPNGASTQNMSIPLVWSAGLDGVLSDNLGDNLPRIKLDIKQAFDQSPYLKSDL